MTVLDTSAVVDFLLADGAAADVAALLERGARAAAPDVLVLEVVAVLRRDVGRRVVSEERARGALADLGDLPLELFPTLPLRERAFELRESMTAADALFGALAEALGEPLTTKDARLARDVRAHVPGVEVVELGRE